MIILTSPFLSYHSYLPAASPYPSHRKQEAKWKKERVFCGKGGARENIMFFYLSFCSLLPAFSYPREPVTKKIAFLFFYRLLFCGGTFSGKRLGKKKGTRNQTTNRKHDKENEWNIILFVLCVFWLGWVCFLIPISLSCSPISSLSFPSLSFCGTLVC